ncbi:MAG: TIGR04283 family arsenosugar biosynthesis glycosyltransferase [Candidatus Binatus sp.]|uniref:TIGR04283 family arsenosugar biosynthesis glycosyltransferase n=1 Tax=Candidatus Binatus sp. TaxID=2811406 RepID=UPI003D0B9F28
MKTLSAIVPMLNEAAAIASTLGALRRGAPDAEIVVVDGGSIDSSVALAQPLCDAMIGASRGRAHQMNAGARESHGDVLVFVHADTLVPSSFAADIASALSDPAVVGGRFDVRLDSATLAYRIIGAMISIRSRISRTGTGDQAIFVRREVFDRLGGFPDFELCEDLEFARRLKRAGRVACLRARVTTSARRWNRDGVIRTIVRMWLIRAMYLMGVAPARLKRMYSDSRQP